MLEILDLAFVLFSFCASVKRAKIIGVYQSSDPPYANTAYIHQKEAFESWIVISLVVSGVLHVNIDLIDVSLGNNVWVDPSSEPFTPVGGYPGFVAPLHCFSLFY